MNAIDAIATAAEKESSQRTAEEWRRILGGVRFQNAIDDALLMGPSGSSVARCTRCANAGHLAPVTPRPRDDSYDLFCGNVGTYAVPASRVERYRVPQTAFLRKVAIAFEIRDPAVEYYSLEQNLHFLGRGWIGKRPFSVLAALNLHTTSEWEALDQRNQEGFGAEPGLILCRTAPWRPEQIGGAHRVTSFGEVLQYTADGLGAKWSAVRRLLGLPGRPRGEFTKSKEAENEFQAMLDEAGAIPPGTEGFKLLRKRRPDLAEVSDSTLYAAKKSVLDRL